MTARKVKDKGRLEPFVPLLVDTLRSPAWRALSHGARSLYVALRAKYSNNFKNNGKIFLSQRDAKRELGSGFEEIGNWFRELEHYGFIVQTAGGCLGVEGVGKAPHWRLTEVGYMKEFPTKDFMRWDGTKFERRVPSRKQNPATESRSTLHRKAGALALRKAGAVNGTSAPESRCISAAPSAPESRSITSITTRGAPNPSPLPPWQTPCVEELDWKRDWNRAVLELALVLGWAEQEQRV